MKSPNSLCLFIDRSLFVFCFSLCHLFFFKLNAQTYPLDEHIHDVQWKSYQPPNNTPNYLIPFRDPITGNKITRISDKDIFGCDCKTLRHNYSKNQPWNADGSLIKTDGSYAKILDGNTYEVLRTANPKSLWSNIDPRVTFETAQNKFYKNNIDTNKETVLRIFSEYQIISIGYGEGNLSNDDRWIALIGTNGKNQTVLVYDILNDAIVGSKFIGTAPMDWASVSQSGQFVVIRYYTNGSGNHQGVKSYNRKMQNEVHLLNLGAHADIGYDMAGNEVYVSVGRYQGHSLSYTRLDNGFTKGLWRSAWIPGDRGIAGAHASTRNLKRPGWAYISTDQQAHDPLVYDAPKEIFAIRLDDSETIERFGKHHTKFDGSKSPYNHETHPVPNRDGTKVIFASNWHNSQWMKNEYPMMWVVEADQNSTKITANAGSDVSICQGASTILTATGGSTYVWSTGAKTTSIKVSPSKTTTYTVTAYDSAGNNSDTDGVTVTVNPLPEVNAGSDMTIEAGEPVILTATGADSYQWSNGEVTSSITVSPTNTTTYTVIGTINSCEASASVTVFSVEASVKANAGQDTDICQGTSTILTASGGSTYLWNTGATTASITVEPSETTTYTVTVYGSMGSNSDTDEVTVTVNATPEANAGEDQSICKGKSTILTASGGTSYLWNTGATTASIEVSPTEETIYSVEVSDNNCSSTAEVSIFVYEAPELIITGDLIIDEGESTILTVNGGDNYEWNTGDTTESITVSPNVTTTYSVSALGANGCVSNASFTVTVATKVIANAGADQSLCEGSSATVTATGGSTYLWNTGATSASIDVTPQETTTYTVTAYDATGKNSDTAEVIVTVNPLPEVDAGSNITIDFGESTTLTATGATTYKWSTGATGESITVSPTATRTYIVTGTRNDCEATDTVKVTVRNTVEVVADAGTDQRICEGSSATLTATGGSTYLWNTGEITASISVNPVETTTYTITAYDSTGKYSDKDEVTVTVNPLPTVDAGNNVTINLGESTTLTATGATTYKWSTGTTGESLTVSPTATRTYTVTGTKNGCEVTDTVKVTVLNIVKVIADAGENQSICEGSRAILTATGGSTYLWNTGETTASITVSPSETTLYTVTAYDSNGKNSDTDKVIVTVNPLPKVDAGNNVTINSGESTILNATGATTYKWSTGATSASITVSPTATRTYTVTGVRNGCEATDAVKVIVLNTVEVIADAGADQSVCAGSSATLTATGGATYLWNTGATTASVTVTPNRTTTYTVTVYDSTGKNSDTDKVIVTVNPLPTVDAGNNVTINSGESTTLTAKGAATYKWSTGASSASITVSPSATRTYTVTGTRNACEATDIVKVTVLNPVIVNADAGADQTICEGSSTTLTATGGSTYRWSTGATTASIAVSPSNTTTYTVTAYDTTGKNSDSDKVTVTVNPLPKVDAGSSITIISGDSTILTATGATNYKWSTGAKSASITVSPTTTRTYTVTGTKNGCEATDTVKVTVINPAKVVANAGGNHDICQGSSVKLTATGGDTYLWNTGAKTASITVSPSSTAKYSVTAYVGNASDTAEAVVNVSPNPNVKITNGSEATILEGEFITLSAIGAKTYKWSNGATQPNIAVRPNVTNSYNVTGYVNKCASEKSIKVNVFEKVVADAGEDVTIYRNETTVLTARGPKNSEYLWSTGETSKNITVGPEVDTEYSVMVYHALDSDTANVKVKVIESVDVEIIEDSFSIEFLIHPNPTDGELNIKISGLTNLSSIHLYDLSGKSLYNEIINESDQQSFIKTLNLSDYASGIYLLQLVDNQRVITKKVVLR